MKIIKRMIIFLYRCSRGEYGFSVANLPQKFAAFAPYSGGKYFARSMMTIREIQNMFANLNGHFGIPVESLKYNVQEAFPPTDSSAHLRNLLNNFGSDKASPHNYHLVYSALLDVEYVTGVVEIGIGSVNSNYVSNMGFSGKPGASLRAFKEYFPSAKIVGIDIDREILFNEERIECFWGNQLDQLSLLAVVQNIHHPVQLVIDDGLHLPSANLNSMKFAEAILVKGGYLVIEDVAHEAVEFWSLVASLSKKHWDLTILEFEECLMVLLKKL